MPQMWKKAGMGKGKEKEMRHQYICSKCQGMVDPGELVGSVCIECLEAEQREQERSSRMVQIMNSPAEQMVLNFISDTGGKKCYT